MYVRLAFDCIVKAGLHPNANTNTACENDAYVYVGKFVDCSAFAEAANRPYINVLYVNSLWCTDSRRIAFGYSPNVRHTAECCLPCLSNTSTSNVHIIFECRVRIRVLFVFRCKPGLTERYKILRIINILIWGTLCKFQEASTRLVQNRVGKAKCPSALYAI